MDSVTFIPHPMTPDIVSVAVLDDYLLELEFADGTVKTFDFTPYLSWSCYNELNNTEFFKLVTIENGTLMWPGDIDVDPEILYA